MGVGGTLKTLVIPATISLTIFVLISYLIIPHWQQYRNRYTQYLPLDSISGHSLSLRQRLQDVIARYLVPSRWRSEMNSSRVVASAEDGSDGGFNEDSGEELFEVDRTRREALSLDARRDHADDARRLSRDLEEGFRDDSEDDDEDEDAQNSRAGSRNH